MPKAQITLGADPEFFIVNEMDMEVQVALDLVEGTKEKPIHLHPDLPKEFNFHRDNVMIEVGVPPTSDPYHFTDNINTAINYANAKLMDASDNAEGEMYAIYRNTSVWHFHDEDLADPRAQEFGCEPDQNAYEGGRERVAPGNVLGNARTAGGHIHIGSDQGFNCPNFIVALLCDAYVGALGDVGVSEEDWAWYRQPGIYRDKPYGIEYRSPSNMWCFNNNKTFRVASRAKAVGAYCAATSANKIRKLVESIDWVYVRNRIIHGETNPEMAHAHQAAIRDLRAYGGE